MRTTCRLATLGAFLLPLFSGGPRLGAAPPDDELTPGVTVRVFQLAGGFERLPRLAAGQTPNADWVLPTIDLPNAAAFRGVDAPFVTHVLGWLDVGLPGEHVFRLISDDGSKLWIDGALAVDHDGRHGATPKAGPPVHLEQGPHELRIEHFDGGGNRSLRLEWKPPGAQGFTLVPAGSLRTFADNARVTSPGVKRLHFDTRAGDRREVEGVHPAFAHSVVLPKALKDFAPQIGAMCFLPDGRLIVGTFNPLQRTETALPDIQSKTPDKLYAISGVEHHNPARVRIEVVADGLFEPCGLVAVGDALYVSHRCAITELRDLDGDGFFETRRDVGRGWECWNYHQFTFGLLHHGGRLYAALSTAMSPPGWEGMMNSNAAPNGALRGGIIEVDIASGSVSVIAGGTRTPNGIGWGPGGSMFYSDNQGVWMPTSQVAEIVPGRFYGHYNNTNIVPKLSQWLPGPGLASALCDRVRATAAVYLPQNELANSPSEQIMIESGPYAGQMLVGEITAGGIRRVFLERVNGEWQGAAFRFTQGLSCGINRLAWGPDGALYAGGIGASGNWSWNDTRAGLDRLTPTDITPFEMLAVRAMHDGFEIEFTRPVDAGHAAELRNYEVRQWRYRPTIDYGGPKVDERTLVVAGASVGGDGRRVRLLIPGLRADEGGSVVYIRTDPRSLDGEEIWSTEAWYTLNFVPRRKFEGARLIGPALDLSRESLGVGAPPPAHASVLVGRTAGSACVFVPRRNERPTEGRTQKEIIASPGYVEVGGGSGDLVSRTSFADCRLHVEWFSPPGGQGQMAGNSGVYLHERYEVQVLGTLAGDGPPQNNEAGAIYGVKAADVNASTGPGTWQAYDIFFRSPRFVDGNKTENARMTVFWNGVLVHNDVEVPSPTGAAAAGGERAHPGTDRQVGPVRFQDHASHAEGPVRYRNVWIAPLSPPRVIDGAWRDLFDGQTLDGWAVCGGAAEFSVRDGVIVGSTRPNSGNTFLVTREEFDDFELLLEFRTHADLNSGVQIRSAVEGGVENRAGRVSGYQVEIDPSERAYTGGLYDEARRGWLFPLIDNPAARSAFRTNDWNTVRVLAEGPRVRTWINGVPAADVHDAFAGKGHIALQVHGVGPREDELRVEFRGIRARGTLR